MKYKLAQVFDLELEIAGGKINELSIKGLINEPVNFKVRYFLQKLLKKIVEDKKYYIETEKKLFTDLGAIESEGNLVIPESLEDGSVNPAIETIKKEKSELNSVEIEVNDIQFDLEDFDFNSDSIYPVFMSVAFD